MKCKVEFALILRPSFTQVSVRKPAYFLHIFISLRMRLKAGRTSERFSGLFIMGVIYGF